MSNPLDTVSDWANENIVEPVVDLVDELGDDAAAAADEIAGLLNDVGTSIGQIAGDVLRAMGLDPEQLAAEFLALSENALRAFLDFLNAIKNMQEKVTLLINAKNIVGNNDLSFQQQLSPNHIQAAMVLRSAIQVVREAIQMVGNALSILIELLPSYHLRQVVLNVNPQLAIWMGI